MPVKKSPVVRKKPAQKKAPVRRKPAKKKKSNKKFYFIGFIVISLVFSPLYYGKVLKTFVSTGRWVKDLFVFDEYPHYEKFGVKIPRKYYVHGIDVSSYQQKINWAKVDAMDDYGIRVSFAFIKATEGVTLVDSYFQRNWRETKKAGVIRGAYHYFKPKKSGMWQAKFFLQTVKVEAGDLPPVIDIEETGKLDKLHLQLNLQEYLTEIEKQTKIRPIIYTGYQFFIDNLKGKFDDYPIWIAHYYQPKLKLEKTDWDFWQHADNATVDGIRGKVDMNVFNGDEEDLSALLVQKNLN
ncbi:MAG: glycoside hydrolase family 25 protein [Pedobacter sp.]|nr:MAG: glycoside hydrolase family 25 protein [Pedobacter sp.]